jgi:hypothetical protein
MNKSGPPAPTLLQRVERLEARLAEIQRERDAERRRTLSEVQAENHALAEAIKRHLDGAGLQKLAQMEENVQKLLERDAKLDVLAREMTDVLREHHAMVKAEQILRAERAEVRGEKRAEVDFRQGHRRAWIALGLTLFGLVVSAVTAVATSWTRPPASKGSP